MKTGINGLVDGLISSANLFWEICDSVILSLIQGQSEPYKSERYIYILL